MIAGQFLVKLKSFKKWQELKVHQSFDEYLRAWVLIHVLHELAHMLAAISSTAATIHGPMVRVMEPARIRCDGRDGSVVP